MQHQTIATVQTAGEVAAATTQTAIGVAATGLINGVVEVTITEGEAGTTGDGATTERAVEMIGEAVTIVGRGMMDGAAIGSETMTRGEITGVTELDTVMTAMAGVVVATGVAGIMMRAAAALLVVFLLQIRCSVHISIANFPPKIVRSRHSFAGYHSRRRSSNRRQHSVSHHLL